MTCPVVIRVTTSTGPPGVGLPAGTADAGKFVRKAGATPYAYELVTPDQVGLPQGLATTSSPTFAGLTLSSIAADRLLLVGSNGLVGSTALGSGLAVVNGALTATASGSGTVSSVALSLPGIFSVSGSPITTSGTLSATLASQTAGLVFAGPASGAAAAPTFRALTAGDIPTLSTAKITGLAVVATSGAYGDLSGRPTLGSAAPLDVAATGDASAFQVVKGDDSRLADSRTPTAHTQAASTISDSTAAGRALLTAASAAAQRTALGLGTAATANTGTAAGNVVVLDGSGRLPAVDGSQLINLPSGGGGGGGGTVTSVGLSVPTGLAVTGSPITTSGNITISLAAGYSIPTTASQGNWDAAYSERLRWDGGSTGLNAATARTSLGLGGAALLSVGTAAGTVAAGDDARFTTDLSYAASTRLLASSTGADVTLPLATATDAGLLAAADKSKLDGIAAGATANATDAQLRDRSTHTGTQSAATITGLATVATSGAYADLSGRPTLGTAAALNIPTAGDASLTQVVRGDDSRLTDSREWSASTISQAEAEAGVSTTRRAFSALRVFQAVDAWWQGISTAAGRALITAASAAAQRTALGLGTAATAATGDFAAASHTQAASTISDSTIAGRALLTAADATAQRTALGLGSLATQSGTFSGTSSGTNTGDQTITLTGDVTGSGTGSFAATLANTAVTGGSYGSASQVGTFTVDGKGRLTFAGNVSISIASTAISDSTAAGRAILTGASASAQRTSLGLGTAATAASTDFVSATGTQSANAVLAGPSSGSAAAPTFRGIVAQDLPASVFSLHSTLTAAASTYTLDATAANEFTAGAAVAGNTTITATNLGNIPSGYVWRCVFRFAYTSGAITFAAPAGFTAKSPVTAPTLTAGRTYDVIARVLGGGTVIDYRYGGDGYTT